MSKHRGQALHGQILQAVSAGFRVQAEKDGTARVEGYAARYENWFVVADHGAARFERINRRGMFARSLSQNPDVVLRLNHQQALARTGAGSLRLFEDKDGLRFEGELNLEMPSGKEVYEMLRSGLADQASVMYWPTQMEETKKQDGDVTIYREDVTQATIDKGDVSVVIWGANPQCTSNLAQAMEQALRFPGGRAYAHRLLGGYDQSADVEAVEAEDVEVVAAADNSEGEFDNDAGDATMPEVEEAEAPQSTPDEGPDADPPSEEATVEGQPDDAGEADAEADQRKARARAKIGLNKNRILVA